MRKREIIHTDGAPKAIGPYSQALRAGEMIFTSGQLGLDPASGKLVEGGIEAQTRQVLENLGKILRASGSDVGNILKTTIFITKIDEFPLVNKIYGESFPADPPARSTVEVSRLPMGALIMIDAVALIEE